MIKIKTVEHKFVFLSLEKEVIQHILKTSYYKTLFGIQLSGYPFKEDYEVLKEFNISKLKNKVMKYPEYPINGEW